MNIGSFFIKLGVVSDEGAIQKFSTVVNQGVSELKSMSVAAIAVGFAVNKLTNDLVNSVVGQDNFNKQTGLSIDLLNKWQKAAALSDVTLNYEEIQSNIQGIQKNLTELQFGRGNTEAFKLLGFDVTGKNAFEVLEQVRGSIKGISNAKATNLIEKMGLSPKFISVLRLSRQEFDQLAKGDFLSTKQRRNVIELGTAFTKMKLTLNEIKDRTLANILPLLKGFFGDLENIGRAMGEFLMSLGRSEAKLRTFQALLLLLAAVFAPIATAVSVAILLFDDLWSAINGKHSLIGTTLKMLSNPLFWQWGVESATDGIKDLYNWLVKITETPIFKILDKIVEFFDKKHTFKIDGGAHDFLMNMFRGSPEEKLQQGASPGVSASSNNSKTAEVSNTYNINSNGNGEEIAGHLVRSQETMYNNIFDDLAGGTL